MDLLSLLDARLFFGFFGFLFFLAAVYSQHIAPIIMGVVCLVMMGLIGSAASEPISEDFFASRSVCEKVFMRENTPTGQSMPTRFTALHAQEHCENLSQEKWPIQETGVASGPQVKNLIHPAPIVPCLHAMVCKSEQNLAVFDGSIFTGQ